MNSYHFAPQKVKIQNPAYRLSAFLFRAYLFAVLDILAAIWSDILNAISHLPVSVFRQPKIISKIEQIQNNLDFFSYNQIIRLFF